MKSAERNDQLSRVWVYVHIYGTDDTDDEDINICGVFVWNHPASCTLSNSDDRRSSVMRKYVNHISNPRY